MRRLYRRVVIESPFGGPSPEAQEENLRYLRACMRDCLDRGESPYASHGLYTQPGVLNDWDPQERERGILAGFEWRAVSQATIVYADRGITKGMRAGIRKATDLQSQGVFDHYVEYRFLGGEWSALGGPEEIKKHLDHLLDDPDPKHRHLALVTGPSPGPRQMHVMPTPAELSMAHVSTVKKVESPTGPSGLEGQALEALEQDATVGAGVPSRSYTRAVAEEAAAKAQLDRISEATRFAENRLVKDAEQAYQAAVDAEVPIRGMNQHRAVIDDAQPFVRSELPNGPRAESYQRAHDSVKKFEGEFGGESGFDLSDGPGRMHDGAFVKPKPEDDLPSHVVLRGRTFEVGRDGWLYCRTHNCTFNVLSTNLCKCAGDLALTVGEIEEALAKGAAERAAAEKLLKRPPRH